MKKIYAALLTFAVIFMASLVAAPAHATPDRAEGKPVTFCHYHGSNDNGGSGKYDLKVDMPIAVFLQAGHIDHSNDIWEAFVYYTNDENGEVVEHRVPAQGNTDLLAFSNCEKPADPTKVTPTVSVVDECGVKNDKVTVSNNPAYESEVVKNGLDYTVNVTANQGFILDLDNTWTVSDDGQRASKTFTLTNENCDLPATGGAATYNTTLGGLALAGAVMLGLGMMFTRKRI